MNEEIKPCPFCGADTHYEYLDRTRFYYIQCNNCNAMARGAATYEGAVNYWNMRHYDYDVPAIVKKVQRMEAAINQAITDCIPLLSWVNDDDTSVEMVEHLSEILGGALCKQPE